MGAEFIDPTVRAAWRAATSQRGQLEVVVAELVEPTLRYYSAADEHLRTVTHDEGTINQAAEPMQWTPGDILADIAIAAGVATYVIASTAPSGGTDILRAALAAPMTIVAGSRPSLVPQAGSAGLVLKADEFLPATDDPDWLAGKPLNQWFEVANTTVADLVTVNRGAVGVGIFHDYNGIVHRRNTGKIYGFGGGHGGTSSNPLAGIDFDDDVPAWYVECEPNVVGEVVPAVDGETVTEAMMWWGTAPNRKPNPPHVYNSGQYIAALDRLLWLSRFGPYNFGGGVSGHNSYLLSTGAWAQPGSADELTSVPGSRATVIGAGGLMYSAGAQNIESFDGSTLTEVVNNGALNWSGFGTLLFDSTRNRLFRVGDFTTDRFFLIDGLSGSPTVTNINPLLTGDSGVLAALRARVGVDTCGGVYDPINDRYEIPSGLSGGAFYAIDAETWAVTLESPSTVSGTVPAPPSGSYDRIAYLSHLKTIVYFPRADANAWARRLAE